MSAEKRESRGHLLRMLECLGKRERHIGEVIFGVYDLGMSRVEAFSYVARKFDVTNPTVQSKFYRGVGLKAAQFDEFLNARDWVGLFRHIEHACCDAPHLHTFFKFLQDEPPKIVMAKIPISRLSEMSLTDRKSFILNLLKELENDQ